MQTAQSESRAWTSASLLPPRAGLGPRVQPTCPYSATPRRCFPVRFSGRLRAREAPEDSRGQRPRFAEETPRSRQPLPPSPSVQAQTKSPRGADIPHQVRTQTPSSHPESAGAFKDHDRSSAVVSRKAEIGNSLTQC